MFTKFRKIWMVLLFSSIAGMSAHGNNGTVERSDRSRFAVMVGSGFGNYQDIQLPDYIPETMRIDGKASVPKGDSQSHSGAPIFMRLSFFQERDELLRGAGGNGLVGEGGRTNDNGGGGSQQSQQPAQRL